MTHQRLGAHLLEGVSCIHPAEPLSEGSKNPSRSLIQRAMILLMGPARLWMEGRMGDSLYAHFIKGICIMCPL